MEDGAAETMWDELPAIPTPNLPAPLRAGG